MTLDQYIDNINKRYKLGNATEHTFRGDLQQLIESITPEIRATNEPKRQSCGAPDYILTKKDIPVGFIEAKDIGDKDLDGLKKTGNKEQFDRYKASLNNLIFTDYINFHLYQDGQFVCKISIAELTGKGIKPLPENFAGFTNLIKDFCIHIGQTLKSSRKLAEMMAGKARLLSDVIEKALNSDEENKEDSTLKEQMNAFKQILIHDITPKAFADVYAQTITYGMFAARLHDSTMPTFSRQEAAELIPKSNPFLRKLFGYIAGPDIDDRIKWIVDSLAEIFLACNIKELLKDYGKASRMEDPIIHFYETFLSEYDAALRKARGVWYTPHPVVNFQVRAIDDILKTEFGLSQGIADSSKINVKINIQGKMIEKEVHRVQFLDPATGTGTYIAEVIKEIYKKFKGQQGIWSSYVENDLLPRLIGFELLMASYAMAHLQIDLLLTETNYNPSKEQRLKIYLTNSLEESHPDTGTLFANWLSNEANEANFIKRDIPVMVVMGNPPYSGESANKGEWIAGLMEDYKKEPGGKEKLRERNPKWINDDYVKFIRYGQHYIEKNGSGILAFINPHGFLDNPTFRGMRWNLLKTYDKIYIIDLHGNSKKKETAPDGSADQNVFDIQQGVSINIFVKTGKKKANELGKVFHFDLFGKREIKNDFLLNNSLKTIPFKELPNVKPNYFFVIKDNDEQKNYDKGFSLNELFKVNSVGIVSARDEFTIHKTAKEVKLTIEDFLNLDDEQARIKYNLGKDVRDWQVNFARNDLQKNYPDNGKLCRISYRPFDYKWTFYTGNSKGFHCYPRNEVMQHFFNGENVGLVFKKGNAEENSASIMVTKNIIDFRSWSRPGMQGGDYVAPLYLKKQIKNPLQSTFFVEEEKAIYKTYNKQQEELSMVEEPLLTNRQLSYTVNFSQTILRGIEKSLGISYELQYNKADDKFGEVDLLDYIYAVLHSPAYRKKYKKFLKIDFPRVPYPKAPSPSERAGGEVFWQLVKLGSELRQIHLMESPTLENYTTEFNVDGDCVVTKPSFVKVLNFDKAATGNVFINETQHFENVPEIAWNFYIGGYQPAQKWLKDRKDRKLIHEDIQHYQKIIVALSETDRIMKEIDKKIGNINNL